MDLAALESTVNAILLNPSYHGPLSVLKGLRNGLTYGTKIRFPHALVMVLLFRSEPLRQKLQSIFAATRAHATTLGSFVALYKALMLFLRTASPSGKEEGAHAFWAGLLAGWAVFGRGPRSAVKEQIVVYVFARVCLAAAKLGVEKGAVPGVLNVGGTEVPWWGVFAALSWGCVMWLFRWHPEKVQGSLRSSMTYLYTNADHWTGWKDFLWHNK
ncbi:Tim17/Tim22/Tim23/Pmp24 family-domain-containing protein [Geopyxis carbonaria]|nr:Tim17/Tim22/Tim23/Pmp24 family-domain-containing protein [Geopyxis carbonaria]